MKKILLALALLTFSSSSMAYEITCTGQTTKAKMVLGLTGKGFLLNKADYLYAEKVIQTSGYEFGIQSSKDSSAQKLTYKFITLKKHPLAKKNSDLIFTIRQSGSDAVPSVFTLKEDYEAELKMNDQASPTLLDKMTCQAI